MITTALSILGVEMNTLIALVAAIAVCGACVMLIFHHDYDDGLIGRIGLGLIALASLAVATLAIDRAFHDMPLRIPQNVMTFLWCGLTLFFGRHVWRFLRRRSRAARGDGDWWQAAK